MTIEHIEDLKVYVQVIDSGHLAAAGRVLGLSATLVSRRLARLEAALGVRLLTRTTRRLHVTDEGKVFYSRCQRILSELAHAQRELLPTSNEISGTVRVVLPTSMLSYGIMDALNDFMLHNPLIVIQVQISDEPVDLLAGGWDVGTHIGVPNDSSHIGRHLGAVSPKIAATPEYLARYGLPESPLELSQHDCIRVVRRGVVHEYWPIIDKQGEVQKVPISGRLICHDFITLYSAMCAGVGIGLIPLAALRKAQAKGELIEILPDCRIEGVTLYAIIPAGRNKLPRVQVFVNWLRSFMETLDV
ncbi:LysR family transcriptional regulator [Shewanella surugensis]|uniref:LysR family transcriptional regulator n=1 Tax=Shewanella surugensis TaxID=212020 RepID=A0ABT0LHI2_9GAMM|nr:LysR family transcriptional regulator [Shewanella surugensis]MCL1127163.1 LysR family transcriptional regulator [Shewanella surugensis]